MEAPVIKTYSRKQPVAAFKTSSKLVPSYADPRKHPQVRESRLNDQTLEVESFNDTFDRLLHEAGYQHNNQELVDQADSPVDRSNESVVDDDPFKIPSVKNILMKARKKDIDKDSGDIFGDVKQTKKRTVKKKTVSKKRKKMSDNSSDDDVDDDTDWKNPKSVGENSARNGKKLKKSRTEVKGEEKKERKSPLRIKLGTRESTIRDEIPENSKELDLDVTQINKSKSVFDGNSNTLEQCKYLQNPVQSLRPHLLEITNNIPSSTPLIQKSRLVLDVHSLSPITLDQEKNEYGESSSKSGKIAEPKLQKVSVLEEIDSHDGFSDSVKNLQLLKSKSNLLRSEVPFDESEGNPSTELLDGIQNNDIVSHKSDILPIKKPNIIVTSVEDLSKNSVKVLVRQPISKSQLLNTIEQQNERQFDDSPLLFDDTQDSLIHNKKNSPTILNKNGGITQCTIQNPDLHTPEKSDRSSVSDSAVMNNVDCKSMRDASKNDLSYYPDDWTNDYNSSYEYSKNKNNTVDEQAENVQDSYRNISNKYEGDNLSEDNEGTMTDHESQEVSMREDTLEQNDEINNSGVATPEISKVNNLEENSAIANDYSSELSRELSTEVDMTKSISRIIQDNFENDSIAEDYSLRMSQNTSQEENPDDKTDKEISLMSHRGSSNEKIARYSDENNHSSQGSDDNEEQINFVSEQTDKDISADVNVEKSMDQFMKEENEIMNIKQPIIQLTILDDQSEENSSPELTARVSKRRRVTKISENSTDESYLKDEKEKIFYDESIEDGRNVSEKKSQTQELDKKYIKRRLRSRKSSLLQSEDQDLERETHVSEDFLNINGPSIDVVEKTDKIIAEMKNDPRLNGQELIVCIPKLDDMIVAKMKKSNRISKKKTAKKSKTMINNPKKKKVTVKKIKVAENKSITTVRGFVNTFTETEEKIRKKLIDKELRILVEKLEIPAVNYSPILSGKKRVSKKNSDGYPRKSKNIIRTEKKESISVIYNDVGNKKQEDSLEANDLPDIPSKKSTLGKDLNKSSDGQELGVLLSKLNDPVRITMRKNVSKKWDKPLAVITEDQPSNIIEEDEENEITEELSYKNLKILEQGKDLEEENTGKFTITRSSQPIFLKPGKSWARSLSIINHFHNGQNLDEFAVGRGQNWRHSVQTILNMQPESFSNNDALKDNEVERTSYRNSFAVPIAPPRDSKRVSNKVSLGIISPTRLSSKRFSTRIIPSDGRYTLMDDLTNSERISYVSDRTRKTSLNRKTSLKIRRDTLIESEEDLIRSAEDIVLRRCKQTSYLPFNVCFPDSFIDNCRKIGEGVYGEVFLYDNGDEKSVIKIIPIEGSELVNCEPQKKFHEILSEIIIAEELHKLRFGSDHNTSGFVGVNRIMCVIGKYPEKLIDLWNKYDSEKNSENDCPSMFGVDQLYIILELAHGGQDLEAYTFQNAIESFSVFLQTAMSLAVAERSLEFEHRDLHWGNILISKTDDTSSVYKLDENNISLDTKGVKVAVIDFTLSRMSYQGCKIFNDLSADPTLFTAQGEYQFDIYRMMKDSVDNDWQKFNPHTNILWLDYVLDKMITAARYKRKTTKIHKTAISDMKELRKEILTYKSAFDFVSKCEKITSLLTTGD